MADVIEAVNALRDAVIAIEKELGISPKKIYANLRARLDILENRINNPSTPSPSVDNPFIVGTSGITISAGTNEPTSSEPAGSLYLRSDGEVFDGIYSNRSGTWKNISNYTSNYLLTGDSTGGNTIDLRLSDNSRINLPQDGTYVLTLKTIIKQQSGLRKAYFENVVLLRNQSNSITIESDTQPIQITNGTTYSLTISSSIEDVVVTIDLDTDNFDDRKAQSIVEVQQLL